MSTSPSKSLKMLMPSEKNWGHWMPYTTSTTASVWYMPRIGVRVGTSNAGLLVSVIFVIGGLVLFAYGTMGSTTWVASVVGAESNITDAAPGTILFVAGVLLAVITRYNIKIKE